MSRCIAGVLVLAGVCLVGAAAAAPGPRAAIPRDPAVLARTLVETKADLARAIDAWRDSGELRTPDDVTLNALYEQRIELLLAARPRLAGMTLRQLPGGIAAQVRTDLVAKRELWRLTPVSRRRR